ncbi:DUF6259 domain-containing protein [bacterium]|nr:DUF6259 domain-containing protein [bacterium]
MQRLAPAALALLVVTAACAQEPFLAVRVQAPSGVSAPVLPVIASVPLGDARRAWGVEPRSGLIGAAERLGDQVRAVPAQLDIVGQQAQIALLLPSQPAGERTIRLAPVKPPTTPTEATLQVTRDGQAVTITNATYVITHDPAKNGGLPSRIVFPQTGKVFDSFQLNDRLHSKQPGMGGFRLGDDKAPQVTVTAAGPLYAEMRVKARYLQGAKEPPGKARAVYTYSYFAGLPNIRLTASIAQDETFDWNELHCFELFFKDDSFTHYVSDTEPLAPFKDEAKSHGGAQWGALVDGKNAIALLGFPRIYDGKNDYGRYLHGPWVGWNRSTEAFVLDLWIGAADDPARAIASAAQARQPLLSGTVYSAKLLGQVATIRQRSQTQPRLGWMLSLLEGAMRQHAIVLSEAERAADGILVRKADAREPLTLGDRSMLLAARQRLALAAAPDHSHLISLYDLDHGRELLSAPALWFRLELANAEGTRRTLDSMDFAIPAPVPQPFPPTAPKLPPAPLDLRFRCKRDSFPGLEVVIRPTLGADRLSWSLAVNRVPSGWSLLSVTSPVVEVGALGGDPGDDRLLLPNGFGRAYPTLNGTRYRGNYPSGNCAMQWMAVTDGASGLYVGAHDATASTKFLDTQGTAGEPRTPLSIIVPASNATVPGNNFTVPGEFVLAVVDGGYFPACRLYRRWLDRNAPWWPEPGKFSRSDYPTWLTKIQTWVEWGAGYADKTVPQTKAFAEAMGTPTAIHWYNWHQIPFDNDYPHYFPTKPGFREGVRELQQAGIRVMPYINGRLWDTDTEDFKAEAFKYATKREDGKPYIEVYGSKQELAPMCVHTAYWQDKVREIVLKLVSEEGVDAVYIDQVAAAHAVLCYDKSHGHPLAGGHWWVDGYWKMLGALQQEIARVNPDKMLTTESNAESYAKYFDAYLMCNDNSDYDVPLFPAVYGGKILMFGTYMANSDWQDLTLMAVRQGKLFAFGAQLWWSDPNIVKNEQATRWLRDVAQLRQRVNEFFVHGQMAAPPAFAEPIPTLETPWRQWGNTLIAIHTPELWATAWRLEDGRLLIALVNLPKQDRTLTLRFEPTAYGLKSTAQVRIERMTPGGVAETLSKQGKFVLPIKLGPAEATALVITPQ